MTDTPQSAYIDRGTGTKFCEHCYQRAARSGEKGEVAG